MKNILLDEYVFGEPWRLSKQSVSLAVPVLRRNAPRRHYLLLQEIRNRVKITDTGAISVSEIENRTDDIIFVRSGTLIKGETQERGVTVGTVVLPRTTGNFPVQCVHASKPIRGGAHLSAMMSVAPRQVESSFLARRGQSATWSAVVRDVGHLYSLSPTRPEGRTPNADERRAALSDDLVGVLEQTERFKEEIEDALKTIPADLEDQVGMAILNVRGVVGVEVFDHPDSWRAFSKSIVRNYADILTEEGSDFLEVKMDRVIPTLESFLQKLATAKERVVAEVQGSKTYALDAEDIVGEYTELQGRVIHMIARRREKEPRERGLRAWYSLAATRRQGSLTEYSRIAPSIIPSSALSSAPSIAPVPAARDQHEYERYLAGKGALGLLASLKKPKTWKDLEASLELSTRTLSKRVDEAKELDLIAQKPRLSNGRYAYSLSEKGKRVVRWAKSHLR